MKVFYVKLVHSLKPSNPEGREDNMAPHPEPTAEKSEKSLNLLTALRKVLVFVKPYKVLIFLSLILAGIKAVQSLLIPMLALYVLDEKIIWTNSALLWGGIGAIFILVLFQINARYRMFMPELISQKVARDMRLKLYSHLQRLNSEFYQKHKSGEITSRVIYDISQASPIFASVYINLVYDVIQFVCVFTFLCWLHSGMTAIIVIFGIVYGFVVRRNLPKFRSAARRLTKRVGEMAGFLQERFLGMKIIQSYTNEAITEKAVKGELTEVYSTSVELVRLRSIFRSVAGFFPVGAGIVVLFFGTWLRMNGILELKELFAFYIALGPMFFVMERSADSSEKISHGIGSLDKVLKYLDAQPAIEDRPGIIAPETFSGEVAFEDVTFRYPGNVPAVVLDKMSFRIPAGKSIALVGASGSGKTTTADLISRFFDPQEGAIYFDGKDIRDLPVKWLRSQIGVVMQESILFSGSIRENLLIGKPSATTDEINTALDQACALEFVNELPQGIDDIIGERGCTLSGGQQQRLAIARAFLKDPKILILDEATSSLDSETEALVQEALERLMVGRTTVIIAHRLSTVKNVDKIIVLSKGKVKEMGTHEELLDKNGIYAMLCEHQLSS